MEELNRDIDKMYSQLTAEVAADNKQKSFDFSSIRDNFRLHVHNRKNSTIPGGVLLDQEMVENLIVLKQKSLELLQNYKKINEPTKSTYKTFSSLDEFVTFVVGQRELLSLELWKLEAIHNYLEQLKVEELSANPTNDSFGI